MRPRPLGAESLLLTAREHRGAAPVPSARAQVTLCPRLPPPTGGEAVCAQRRGSGTSEAKRSRCGHTTEEDMGHPRALQGRSTAASGGGQPATLRLSSLGLPAPGPGGRQGRGRRGPAGGAPASPTPAPRATPRRRRSPKTRMFLPDGSLDLARVDTSLRIEDLRRQRQSGQSRDPPGPPSRSDGPAQPGRALPGPADPARPSRGLTIGSGPPLPHWSGRRRPPPRARWGPAAPSSPPPPAPSCQLQPQRGPSPGSAEDPRGPWPGRPPPAVRRLLRRASRRRPCRSASPAGRRRERDAHRPSRVVRPLPWREAGGGQAAAEAAPAQGGGGGSESRGGRARWRPLPAQRCNSTLPGSSLRPLPLSRESPRQPGGQTRGAQVLE